LSRCLPVPLARAHNSRSDLCNMRGWPDPTFQDVSDRRGTLMMVTVGLLVILPGCVRGVPIHRTVSSSSLTVRTNTRTGGRTAWSCIVVVQGTHFPARFWYDGQYADQSREDCSEVAYRRLTGTLASPPQHHASAQNASSGGYYSQSSG
jgi:hypothetical protein